MWENAIFCEVIKGILRLEKISFPLILIMIHLFKAFSENPQLKRGVVAGKTIQNQQENQHGKFFRF